MQGKALFWVGGTLGRLRGFSAAARREAGHQLYQVQLGLDPSDGKPMPSVGPGVVEIRVHESGEYRVLYVAKFVIEERALSTRLRRSSGNVFRDLGFPAPEAENLRIRSELIARLRKLIASEGLTQAEAARRFGVSQPRVSDLVRGRIELFSIDTLVNLLARAGVRLTLSARARRRAA